MRVKKLSEIKGARAFDAFASLIPVVFELVEDKEAMEVFLPTKEESRLDKLRNLITVINRHRFAFLEIEAIKRGCGFEELELSMDDIITASTELLNDDLFLTFFVLARKDGITSTCVPDNTEVQNG